MVPSTWAPQNDAEASPTEQGIELLEVRVLRVQPNDVLVVRLAKRISEQGQANIRQLVEEQFPGHRCLVLDSGMELSVARPELAAEESTPAENCERCHGSRNVMSAHDPGFMDACPACSCPSSELSK